VTRLLITPLAETDIEEIADHIALDAPERAIDFAAELHEQCKKIAANPRIYRVRDEFGNGIRSCAYGNYVIFFHADDRHTNIVRVFHGARDIKRLFGKPD
jgi:toxin ParE1/3/4